MAETILNQLDGSKVSQTPKPIEAVRNLRQVAAIIASGHPLPPSLRNWLTLAIYKRLADPGSNLDSLLGLKGRGGRLHAFSSNPQRDFALRKLAPSGGTQSERVAALRARIISHKSNPDEELVVLEKQFGKIPSSVAQLHRILGGKTGATRYIT